MPVHVQTVLDRAAKSLSDVDGIRWPAATKLDYFNDGLLEIAVQKPSAFSRTVELELVEGTLQAVPDEYSTLIRVVRNVDTGRVVTPARRDVLNDQFLDWHSPEIVPYSPIVQHVCADEFEPRRFYVFPGNDGTGKVEAILALIPEKIEAVTSETEAELDRTYANALANYIAFRCYGEDMILNNAPPRAQAHYELFQAALGIRQNIEGVANVNTANRSYGA